MSGKEGRVPLTDRSEARITFQKCFNFRDLGGYKCSGGGTTRLRRLFRSDTMHRMTDEDKERVTTELRIKTVIDVRPPTRARRLAVPSVEYLNLPLLDDEQAGVLVPRLQPASADAFQEMLTVVGPNVPRLFDVFADESAYPIVFHCAAGIHRTSLVAALVLGTVGVTDEDIVTDYASSNQNMERFIAHARAIGRLPSDGSFPAEFPRTFFESPSEAMVGFLRWMRTEHGSVRTVLMKNGVADSTLGRLEDVLLNQADVSAADKDKKTRKE